ncbi:MAG TPA: thiamine pyrophosphate-binding protein [Jiangellaceae bacterium]|nr:thiamine pyrophosphate-binding protein [Jiangellaceae bacterium]
MLVAEAVGRALADHGVRTAFGVVGSGNFHATNALVAAGVRFVAAAHEGGAATMADAYARTAREPTVLSVHQGPGVTNALTGITEAAKSRTPLLMLAPEATAVRSNFFIDLARCAASVGAGFYRVRAERVYEDVAEAYRAATQGVGGTVVLGLPLDVQAAPAPEYPAIGTSGSPSLEPPVPPPDQVRELADLLRRSSRPMFIAGRGATRSPDRTRAALTELAGRCGALLAVSAAAKGLFAGDPWYLDVSGGFASPLAADLISRSDLVVAWGSTLNMWTTRHGRLIGPEATVVQVDLNAAALGANRPIDLGVPGDIAVVADAVTAELADWESAGWRSPELARRIAAEVHWRDVPYVDDSGGGRIDPRTLSIALDDLLPADRTIAVDSGNFMGYPSMYLSVPDQAGFCFTQAFQSIGLGLASSIGAALARPDRLTVAALGDGGFLMSAAELATAVRLGLAVLVVVYNDAAYGAEVHHFGPDGHPLETVTFPDTDLAAIGRGFGAAGVTVRSAADLATVSDWLAGQRDTPLVVDAKVTSASGAWWLEEAFRGH